MGKHEFWNLSTVSDERLVQDLGGLLAGSASMEARIVAHLAEVEERRLHLKAATSSLFDYCLRRIGLSESAAFHRITAARLARRFPVIFELLEARAIHLSALRVLRDYLTVENHRELLAIASGKSKREVERLVAALAPRPDVASQIRKLAGQRLREVAQPSVASAVPVTAMPSAEIPVGRAPTAEVAPAASVAAGESVAADPAPPAWRPTETRALVPLSSTRHLLRVSISDELKEKLMRARDLMSHANPSGELELVLDRALEVLLEKLEKQRFAQTERPRLGRIVPAGRPPQRAQSVQGQSQDRELRCRESENARGPSPEAVADRGDPDVPEVREPSQSSGTRGTRREHISNEVRRAVALRDEYQCTYVDGGGRRCASRAFLQLHHEQAHALGGAPTLENLRLLCGLCRMRHKPHYAALGFMPHRRGRTRGSLDYWGHRATGVRAYAA